MASTFTFGMTSRYYGSEVATYERSDGSSIAYLRRRFIPLPNRYATIGEYTVRQNDEPGIVAFRQMGDAEQFWRIADPNAVLRPQELTETPGKKIRITLSEGIPGPTNA